MLGSGAERRRNDRLGWRANRGHGRRSTRPSAGPSHDRDPQLSFPFPARVSALVEPKASKRAGGRLAEGGDVGPHRTSCRQNLCPSLTISVKRKSLCHRLPLFDRDYQSTTADCLAIYIDRGFRPAGYGLASSVNTSKSFTNTACQGRYETDTLMPKPE